MRLMPNSAWPSLYEREDVGKRPVCRSWSPSQAPGLGPHIAFWGTQVSSQQGVPVLLYRQMVTHVPRRAGRGQNIASDLSKT